MQAIHPWRILICDDAADDTDNLTRILDYSYGSAVTTRAFCRANDALSYCLSGAAVDIVFLETVTDHYTSDGVYNLVFFNGEHTVTVAVTVSGGDVSGITADMTKGKTQSVVEIKSADTPPAAVGGLPELFDDSAIYTSDDALVVTGGGTVELKLVVDSITKSEDETQIQGEAASNEEIGLFLDISVIKSRLDDQGALMNDEKLTNLGASNLLTITFELPAALKGKSIAAIYRTHESSVDKLTLSSTPEYFTQNDGIITLHVYKFSTYALAVEKPGRSYTPDFAARWVNPYTDVKAGDWCYDAVQYVTENKLMNGIGGNLFDPDGNTSRAMVATILWRLAGQPKTGKHNFVDVADGQWYSQAIAWSAETGIVKGYGEGIFQPERNVSREEMSAMLYRYVQFNGGGFVGEWLFLPDFADSDLIGDWAYEAVCYCAMHGIVEGKPGSLFDPQGNATRAEIATILMRFCEE